MDLNINHILNAENVDFQALTRSCRRGLHETARPDCWKIIMGFYPTSSVHWPGIEADSLQKYNDVLEACGLGPGSLKLTPSSVSRFIDADVPRTMPSLNFFLADESRVEVGRDDSTEEVVHFTPSQHALRRILISTAMANKSLGYVQGMNEYVGHLLYAFAKGKASNVTPTVEADTFFCFQTLLAHLGDDFCRSFDFDAACGLTSTMRLFDNVLRFFDPSLFQHLEYLGINAEHYALRWIMLLFMQEFNIADSLCVWDFLLSFGDEIRNAAFFVAAAMCHHLRSSILSSEAMSDVLPLLQHYPSGDVKLFLRIALKWIVKFDFNLLQELKQVSPEGVQALRRSHGLEGGMNFVQVMRSWVPSLF
ncbi:GTPase activator-like protein [Leishmania tarentolae]|uniref:GTPase activator-like protein n=1 Tax=Leishmania tarentolae TaxID=5689 RepID=A0A640KME4_LEITA|nr:GTPase activator-like protein [Leishmania tarentolae]